MHQLQKFSLQQQLAAQALLPIEQQQQACVAPQAQSVLVVLAQLQEPGRISPEKLKYFHEFTRPDNVTFKRTQA